VFVTDVDGVLTFVIHTLPSWIGFLNPSIYVCRLGPDNLISCAFLRIWCPSNHQNPSHPYKSRAKKMHGKQIDNKN